MRVTAKDLIAKWVDYSPTAPYHTEQSPVGHDRKRHEGPLPTQESFPNTWLPTKTLEESTTASPTPTITVDQIVSIEIAAANETIPRVPQPLFQAWVDAHDAGYEFDSNGTVETLDNFARSVGNFIRQAAKAGIQTSWTPRLKVIENYAINNPPERREGYLASEQREHNDYIDRILNDAHGQVCAQTRTDRIDWYDAKRGPVQQEMTPEDEDYLSQNDLRERRGPVRPFVEDMWERTRRHQTGRRAGNEVFPGVSQQLFAAWEKAHDALGPFQYQSDPQSLDQLTQALGQFLQLAAQMGSPKAKKSLGLVQNYVNTHPPKNRQQYDRTEMNDHLMKLDSLLNNVHSDVLGITGTQQSQWYDYKNNRGKDDHWRTPSMNLTPEEEKELGIRNRLSPQQLLEQRGPGASFVEEMWERRKRQSMRVTAIDVMRDEEEEIEQQPNAQPKQPYVNRPNPHVNDTNNVANGDPMVLAQTVGEAAEWEESEQGVGVEGSVFSYEKTVWTGADPSDQELGAELKFYAFVEPITSRKKRLYSQADRMDSNTGRGGSMRAEELRREADGMPDRGYINDIECFYQDDLLFHRERTFVPKRALTSREFMAGDAMQRATTDLQQFIRTKVDPVTVGQFIEAALQKPGIGEAKLSHRTADWADPRLLAPEYQRGETVSWSNGEHYGEIASSQFAKSRGKWFYTIRGGNLKTPWSVWEDSLRPYVPFGRQNAMKVSAADVMPFDPSKRRLKQAPQMVKQAPVPPVPEQQEQLMAAPPTSETSPFPDTAPGDDYENLLYSFDSTATWLEDVTRAMIEKQPSLDPAKQKEIGGLIAKMKSAIRALKS